MTRREILDKAVAKIEEGNQDLEDLKFDYEEWRDSMPENLEGSVTYEKLEEAIDMLEESHNEIEAAIGEVEGLELPLGFGRD